MRRACALLLPLVLLIHVAEARAGGPTLLWEDRFPAAAVAGVHLTMTLEIRGSRVYLAVSTPPVAGWEVRAYEAESGRLDWNAAPKSAADADSISSLVATTGRVVAVGPKALRALAAGSGRRVWRRPFPGRAEPFNDVRASALGTRLFVTGMKTDAEGEDHYRVWAHHAVSGELLWKDHRNSGEPHATAAAARRLFVAGYSPNDVSALLLVRAYGARRGERLWERILGPPGGSGAAQAAAASEQSVFVAGPAQDASRVGGFYVAALRASNGQPLWEHFHAIEDLRARITASALTSTGEVLAAAASVNPSSTAPDWSVLRAYRADTGDLLWDLEEPGIADTAALAPLAAGVLAVGSTLDVDPFDRRMLVRAFDAETGALRFEDAGFDLGTFGSCAATSGDLAVVAGATFGTEREILIRAYRHPIEPEATSP